MPQTRAGAASTMHSTARMPSRRTAAPPAQVRTTRYAVSESWRGRAMLDETVPLARGSHRDVDSYSVEGANLLVRLRDGTSTGLAQPAQFVGYRGEARAPSAVLLRNHGLHLEIKIDRGGLVGRDDPAGIADIVLESAVTTIMDLEDSVAAVDAEDKVAVYRNWLGLIVGTLKAAFQKGGRTVHRELNPDRVYTGPGGGELRLLQ